MRVLVFFLVIISFGWTGCASAPPPVEISQIQQTDEKEAGTIFVRELSDSSANGHVDISMMRRARESIMRRLRAGKRYEVVEDEDRAEYVLSVKVVMFTPGNRALRFWVGFGAGAAKLAFTCELYDREGKLSERQDFKRYGAASLRSGQVIEAGMEQMIVDYTVRWLRS